MPYVVLGGAQIAVGAGAIFARYALGGAGPLAVSAARLAIAAVILLSVTALRGTRVRVSLTRAQQGILALAGLALAAHFATWIWSLEYTSVAVSVLLVATTPIWTAIYDAVFHGHRLSPTAMAAFAGGAIGIVMVVGASTPVPPPVSGHETLGAALALAGSLLFGAYLLLVREVRTELDTLTIVRQTFGWAAVALVLAALLARQPLPPLTDVRPWLGILAMALVSQLLGHTALNASLRWFSPSAVAFANLLEPLIAAALAFALFGEGLPATAVIGGLILLASVGVVMKEERFDLDGT